MRKMRKFSVLFVFILANWFSMVNGNVKSALRKFDKQTFLKTMWSPTSVKSVGSIIQCSSICNAQNGCSALRFSKENMTCEIGTQIPLTKPTADSTADKLIDLFVDQSSVKIMLIGGMSLTGLLSRVDLFDPRTHTTCSMKNYPMNVYTGNGAFFNGAPVVVGGNNGAVNTRKCYQYIKNINNWSPINFLPYIAFQYSGFIVPSKGFFAYGGNDPINPNNVQWLPSLAGEWTTGPPNYGTGRDNPCSIQLDATTTVFLGVSNSDDVIVKYDWIGMTYIVQKSKLPRRRTVPACGLIQDSNGQILVAVSGGASVLGGGKQYGMDFWNPLTDTIETNLNITKLPQETNGTLDYAAMVSANFNTELYFFGGIVAGAYVSDVWRYTHQTRSFDVVSTNHPQRMQFQAFLVDAIQCP